MEKSNMNNLVIEDEKGIKYHMTEERFIPQKFKANDEFFLFGLEVNYYKAIKKLYKITVRPKIYLKFSDKARGITLKIISDLDDLPSYIR